MGKMTKQAKRKKGSHTPQHPCQNIIADFGFFAPRTETDPKTTTKKSGDPPAAKPSANNPPATPTHNNTESASATVNNITKPDKAKTQPMTNMDNSVPSKNGIPTSSTATTESSIA